MVSYLDEIDPQQFLAKLAISLTKVFATMRAHENLPTKVTQSIEEIETLLLDEGPLEIKVIATLGRLGGAATPSTLETEASLTSEEVYKAIVALDAAGIVVEEVPGVFQLTAMKTMETTISQWETLANVAELFSYGKRLIEAANDTIEISGALDALRDALFAKGVSGVVISEIAKEARTWRMGSGDKEELLELLTTWKERSLP